MLEIEFTPTHQEYFMNQEAAIDNSWEELEQDNDLIWDLNAITNRNEAIEFLVRFKERLCIYSSFVNKLYTSYDIIMPDDDSAGNITVLPGGDAQDTFHDIPFDAIEETGIFIYPGETVGKPGLYMKIPNQGMFKSSREMPFQEGLSKLVRDARENNSYFLPVLVNGDLREFEDRMPSLHLHNVNYEKLSTGEISNFSLNDIRKVIADNLIQLFRKPV